MAKLIDEGIKSNNDEVIFSTAITMVIMTLLGLICVLICQYMSSIASQGFGTELRNEAMRKISKFSHSEIDKFGTSTLITRITNDINQLQLALAMLIRLVIRAPFLSIGSIIMAFTIHRKIAIIFLITLPVFSFILFLIMKKSVPLYKRVQEKIDRLNGVIGENLSGVRIIRAFAKKDLENKKMSKVTDELANSYNRVANISALLNPLTILIMNFAIIAILYIGGFEVNIGGMKQGEVLALINYMTQMLLALIVVSQLVVIFTRAFASSSRVNEILNTEIDIVDNGHVKWKNEENILNFQNVDFRYTIKSGLALENINFQVNRGMTLGIIGPTGSGKSTLTQLIPRFYDISSGKILINEIPIKECSLNELRDHIAIIPQKAILFSGTIRSNLLWGNENANDEDCWNALKTAQCYDFVKSLKNSLDSVVQAGKNNFSGGQKQRLTIARGIIKKPKILILNDSL